jgi:ketosteroid isomerase-like protein
MAQDNIEIIRKSYEAFQSRQFDLAVKDWDSGGEWMPAMAGEVESRVYRGPAGVRRYIDELFESFSEVRLKDLEFRAFGDRVLALYRLRVEGRDSGVEIDQPGGAVYELRGGKIVRGRSYLSHSEPLEAVGLSGHGANADTPT